MSSVKLAHRLIPVWFICYTGFTWAAASYSQDIRSFDIESAMWAGATGIFGGAFRTILSLASTKTAVYDLRKEALKDTIVALVAGLAAYVVIEGVSAVMVNNLKMTGIPREFRMLFILGAGWMRIGFFGKLDRVAAAAITRVEKQIHGGDIPPPSSEAMPLPESKQ